MNVALSDRDQGAIVAGQAPVQVRVVPHRPGLGDTNDNLRLLRRPRVAAPRLFDARGVHRPRPVVAVRAQERKLDGLCLVE